MIVTTTHRGAERRGVHAALPAPFDLLPYRWFGPTMARRSERYFLSKLVEGDVAYLWSRLSPGFMDEVHARGHVIIREKFSLHTSAAQRLARREHHRLGLHDAPEAIPDAAVAHELEEQDVVDLFLSPSPAVTTSLLDAGISANRILETSYGWSPERFVHRSAIGAPGRGLRVATVGRASVMKGTHLLLAAWRTAQLRGALILAGAMDPIIPTLEPAALAMENVHALGHTPDVSRVYRIADAFALPTLAEGSPLVVYEAMAHGLPVLVSPMGAGAVVRDGVEGFVLDPHDLDSWAERLRQLSDDEELRRRMGAAAQRRAMEFTWDRVGALRRELLIDRLTGDRMVFPLGATAPAMRVAA